MKSEERMRVWKIISPEGEIKEVDELKEVYINCTINAKMPKQMCFTCNKLYEPYLLDDVLWKQIKTNLQDKYICPECFRKHREELKLRLVGCRIKVYSPDAHFQLYDLIEKSMVDLVKCEVSYTQKSYGGKYPFVEVRSGYVLRCEDMYLLYLHKESEDDVGIVDIVAKNGAEIGFRCVFFENIWDVPCNEKGEVVK